MNKILSLFIFFYLIVHSVFGQDVYVKGYYRKNGTYVQPHYRSAPDGIPYNNYSYPGNYNPYTGVTAGESRDTYMNNYYKIYRTYSSRTYDTYTSLLKYTNYSRLVTKNKLSYEVRDSYSKEVLGYIFHMEGTKFFSIRDEDNNLLGYVGSGRNKKSYAVYNSDWQVVRVEKSVSTFTTIFSATAVAVIVFLGMTL